MKEEKFLGSLWRKIKKQTFRERNKATFTGFVGLDDQADVRGQLGDILLIDGSNKKCNV